MPAFALTALKRWKLIGLGLLLMALAVQQVRIASRDNKIEALRIDNNELRAELKSISTAKNEQRETTKQNVEKADKGDKQAREIADKIREAPIVPGKCETPGIEILRNEI